MLASVHWIVTVCPAVNVPEVGPVSVKLGAAGAVIVIAEPRWEM